MDICLWHHLNRWRDLLASKVSIFVIVFLVFSSSSSALLPSSSLTYHACWFWSVCQCVFSRARESRLFCWPSQHLALGSSCYFLPGRQWFLLWFGRWLSSDLSNLWNPWDLLPCIHCGIINFVDGYSLDPSTKLYFSTNPSHASPSHKSHNALDKYPTMHHFVPEMCTHVQICVTKWCIVEYRIDALWDLCNCRPMESYNDKK